MLAHGKHAPLQAQALDRLHCSEAPADHAWRHTQQPDLFPEQPSTPSACWENRRLCTCKKCRSHQNHVNKIMCYALSMLWKPHIHSGRRQVGLMPMLPTVEVLVAIISSPAHMSQYLWARGSCEREGRSHAHARSFTMPLPALPMREAFQAACGACDAHD